MTHPYNEQSDNNLFETEIEVNLVESEDSFQPIPYEELPRAVCDEIDEMASVLIDPDRGHVAVLGDAQTGKSFVINQLIGNISRYTKKINAEPMIFVRLREADIEEILSLPGRYGLYIATLCKEFECSESNFCFVTESPDIAAYLFSTTQKARIILEVSRHTFAKIAELESAGATKIWASWQFVDADEILMKKKELIELLEITLSDKMEQTFHIELDKKLISLFVNHAIKKMPEIVSQEKSDKGIVLVPMGIWAVAIRRLCGILSLSESPDIRTGGKVAIGKVIESVFQDNHNMLAEFVMEDDEIESLSFIGPGGQVLQLMRGGHSHDDDDEDTDYEKPLPLVFNTMEKLDEELHKEIIGQDEAITNVVDGIVVPAAGLHDSNKPVRSFLFLGPTGVGKTKLATTLAEHVADNPMNVLRIDMSEYSQSHEAAKLLGAPPGYAGFEKGGVLTGAVIENPHSVILLDEVEKAHPKIWDSFLQILDAGRMTDGQGRVADFTQSIIIMTSNLGAAEMSKGSTGFSSVSPEDEYAARQKNSKEVVMRAVKQNFRPELINRIDEIVVFKELSEDTARKIVRKEIQIVSDRMGNSGFSLDKVSDDIIDEILSKSNVTEYGARDIQRVVLRSVSNPVAKVIVRKKETDSKNIKLVFDKDRNISVSHG